MSYDLISAFNENMIMHLEGFLPHTPLTDLIYTNPFWSLGIIMVALIMIFIGISMASSLMANAWKVPFAILADALDFMSFISPGFMDLIAVAASLVVFVILSQDSGKFAYVFGAVAAFEAYTSLQFPFPGTMFGVITGVLPTNTLLVVVSFFIK